MTRNDYERMAAKMDDSAVFVPDGVILTQASAIRITPISWLWPGWLALGKLHLLAGAPGQGKTTLALAMAATVSNGGIWPDGEACVAGNVLVWSGEDDPADTLAPRLLGMGANLDKVHFVQGARIDGDVVPFDPAEHMPALLSAAEAIGGVRLIVVDPLVSAITGDSHKNAEVRRGMQPLVDLAAALKATVIGISHLSKGTAGRDPTERVTGSIAFTAVVRVVLLAAKVKDDDGNDKRILVRSKSNIGPDSGGFEYHVNQVEPMSGLHTSIVTWGQSVDGSAQELLSQAESDAQGGTGALSAAEDFLRDLLATVTPVEVVKKEAGAAGHSWATVRRAATGMNVIRQKGGMNQGWYWRLPEGAHESTKALKQKDEHLRGNLSAFGATEAVGDADEVRI